MCHNLQAIVVTGAGDGSGSERSTSHPPSGPGRTDQQPGTGSHRYSSTVSPLSRPRMRDQTYSRLPSSQGPTSCVFASFVMAKKLQAMAAAVWPGLGATLGATRTNGVALPRTHLNGRQRRAPGHGLDRTVSNAGTGIYGSEGRRGCTAGRGRNLVRVPHNTDPPNRPRLRADDCGGPYCRRVADRRNALEKHLGIPEDRAKYGYAREEALLEHVGEALNSENYAAAQVYALLLVAERLDSGTSSVSIHNTEELGFAISGALESDLRRIADNIA